MVERDEQAMDVAGGDVPDPKLLTFSQAQGYEPLPQLLALEELNDGARVRLWSLLYQYAGGGRWINHPWQEILANVYIEFFVQPIDTYDPNEDHLLWYKKMIMDPAILKFNHVFDLLTKIMRHSNCPDEFITGVSTIFKECKLAYIVDVSRPVTIFPASSQQESQALHQAMNALSSAGFLAATGHLKKAANMINQGLWSDSIHESINAVESVARQIAPGTPQALGKALNSLEKQGAIPSALKPALDNLNRYANQPGIRHAAQENKKTEAGQDEAVLMLGVCASFASYLWRKHQGGP